MEFLQHELLLAVVGEVDFPVLLVEALDFPEEAECNRGYTWCSAMASAASLPSCFYSSSGLKLRSFCSHSYCSPSLFMFIISTFFTYTPRFCSNSACFRFFGKPSIIEFFSDFASFYSLPTMSSICP